MMPEPGLRIAAVVLTFNSRDTIARTLAAAARVAGTIFVVDSYSSDDTLDIVARYGATVVQRRFSNYSDQRNWAIANIPDGAPWQLHLDADEVMSDELVAEIGRLRERDMGDVDGLLIGRRVRFLGGEIRFGGMNPTWHLRLFRTGAARCEHRRYDQHFVTSGPVRRLRGIMIDDIRMSLSEWTRRHNGWSDAEVSEIMDGGRGTGEVAERVLGTAIERRRAIKGAYYRLPLFLRAFILFFVRYVVLLGFLDGRRGLIFFVLQCFWFRFLVDAKIWEATPAYEGRGAEAVGDAAR